MSGFTIRDIGKKDVEKILASREGHFLDLKAIEVSPAKLSRSIAAFANADGGELFIGIDEIEKTSVRKWRGFHSEEEANGHIQLFVKLFPFGTEVNCCFLTNSDESGIVLHIEIQKCADIKKASNDKVYIRKSAQNLPVETDEQLENLRIDKGITSVETQTVNEDPSVITKSDEINSFISEVVPTTTPEAWLYKQRAILSGKPTVAGVVLFADLPQAILPKKCGIKISRYKTTGAEGTRESLEKKPISIEGSAYKQIREAIKVTQEIIESVTVGTRKGLESVQYPEEALHEVITNAVLHRNYAVADDIHIKIFDNRVEVLSPGLLPGHITINNILKERFARNGNIVRLINKFPDPPNKDIGEGLNTTFLAMRQMKLREPVISQDGGYVKVELRHERLASTEEAILAYLESHDTIANRQAREVCYIHSENKMKVALQRMVKKGILERVPGLEGSSSAYRLKVTENGGK